ncbi:DUF5615 family PIN-like protein [Romeria aff. gracilis LEGE 07310]|uniref:DUF5615 family PIN-like protein n=1 Tax=Vasconcelosia minhoensis LEGE 07310 TaxID=915328 RepID=A0A8J7DEX3_9CYAN|nr:DUF5615 family PIN-like protein [Romeria gracilis]MBE9080153.1 DUF5615 family PIN-like protein [Romeria aff. gracilis LEGE 07310]
MPIALYMDVHVPQAITAQLRRRNVDVLAAIEDETNLLPDDQLLERAAQLNRVLFTQDIGFRAMAESWQKEYSRTYALTKKQKCGVMQISIG